MPLEDLVQRMRLAAELGRWRRDGRRPCLWWRDDDAREPTPALRRLLDLAAVSGRPLTLAVIPDADRSKLGAALAGAAGICVVQHGVDHRNRAETGGSREFPVEADVASIGTALAEGWRRIAGLPGAMKLFVPPWNAAHPALPAALAAQGYLGWSAWAETAPPGDPPRVDAHLDVLRWKGGGRFRGEAAILGRLSGLLAERRRARLWAAPVGLLTHHLDHDEPAWRFLQRFLARDDFEWRGLPDLLP